jgi:TPP-dependent pyruvate/acetoin dehydrogenase alpha subunit
MKVNLTSEDLIKFEEDVCQWFADKKVKAPVHLDNGNEEQLIDVFKYLVEEDDWVMCSWRSHYKSLLRGVPYEDMKKAICEGKSISLCFPAQRVISSAIVGGILPIAVGTAMGIKLRGEKHKVVCFIGEMTSETGSAHECIKYSLNHDLPILFVLEDNGKSVCTPTLPVWGMKRLTYSPEEYGTALFDPEGLYTINDKVVYYKYDSKYPHAGCGQRINF